MADAVEDVIATDELTVTLQRAELHVGRVSPGALQGCTWPLIKAMLGAGDDGGEGRDEDETDDAPHKFFSLTQEEDELTFKQGDLISVTLEEGEVCICGG